jgi:hypothetical protein
VAEAIARQPGNARFVACGGEATHIAIASAFVFAPQATFSALAPNRARSSKPAWSIMLRWAHAVGVFPRQLLHQAAAGFRVCHVCDQDHSSNSEQDRFHSVPFPRT